MGFWGSFSCQNLSYRIKTCSYIESGYARKLFKEEATSTSNITYYIPHQSAVRPNKPGKLRVAYDVRAQYSVIKFEIKIQRPDFLNNLPSVPIRFTRFTEGKRAVTQRMFHQIIIRKSDQRALRFVWRKCPLKPIEDYVMCLHFFGKLDCPCVVNYTLKKTAIDHRAKYNHDIIDAVHMDDYMELYIDEI